MTPPSFHWLDRLTRRWEFLLDDDIVEGASAVAALVDEATDGDWASLTTEQRDALTERLTRLRVDAPWADESGSLDETLSEWLIRLDEAGESPQEAPLPQHWMNRVIEREAEAREDGRPGAANAMASLLERAEARDWRECGLGLNAFQPDGTTLFHRAARDWPDGIAAMLDAEGFRPVRDGQGRTALDVLMDEWGDTQYVDVAHSLRAVLEAEVLRTGLPAARRPPTGRRM